MRPGDLLGVCARLPALGDDPYNVYNEYENMAIAHDNSITHLIYSFYVNCRHSYSYLCVWEYTIKPYGYYSIFNVENHFFPCHVTIEMSSILGKNEKVLKLSIITQV